MPRRRVHAWSDVVESERGLHRTHDDWRSSPNREGAVLAEEVQAVADIRSGLAVRSELVHDTALRALLHQARDARLLVVGHRGHRRTQGMGLGSTSRALVEFAPCQVIVTPPVPAPVTPAARTTGAVR